MSSIGLATLEPGQCLSLEQAFTSLVVAKPFALPPQETGTASEYGALLPANLNLQLALDRAGVGSSCSLQGSPQRQQ